MISFTYLLSFIFHSEDNGQIFILLLNLIIGVLGGISSSFQLNYSAISALLQDDVDMMHKYFQLYYSAISTFSQVRVWGVKGEK